MKLGYFAIHVPDVAKATTFYSAVFGWKYTDHGPGYQHIEGSAPAGGIAEGDEPHIACAFAVADAAEAVAMVNKLGGTAPAPYESQSGWSVDGCTDGNGAVFDLWQPASGYEADASGGVGDLHYFVLPAVQESTKDFFAELFGWTFTPGSHASGWNITNSTPPGGLFVDGTGGRVWPYFRVENIEAAAKAITAAGGTAGDLQPNQRGWHAICHDDQGVEFGISSLRD